MISSLQGVGGPPKYRGIFQAGLLAVLIVPGVGLRAEPAPYPFEGTWVRSDRLCTPGSPHVRTYTSKDLATPGGRCQLRKIVFGSGEFELFEECRRPEHSGPLTEKIHMLGPDMMVVKQVVRRLKIPRGRRFTRCAAAAAPASAAPAPAPALAKPSGRYFGPQPPAPKP